MDKTRYISKIQGHALVLGASGGIGVEVTRALVANGASALSLTYGKNAGPVLELKAELEAQGVKVYVGSINQLDEAGFSRFLEEAVQAIGEEIAVAVNTIGISPNTPLEEQTFEEWQQVFDVNVHGSFLSTRAIANRMREKGVKGSITLITSTNGINSQSSISAHYDASKSAQGHMMRVFAEHYAPYSIRINGVAPGWIDTKMNDTLPEDERAKEMSRIWCGRFADPAEVATFVAFVAGSGGSYLYGQNFMIDGGYR